MARGSRAPRGSRRGGQRTPRSSERGDSSGTRPRARAWHSAHGLARALAATAPSRFLAGHPHLSAALLLALPVLVYLWPVLLGGEVFSATASMYKLAPWQPYRPADILSYENYLLADVPLAIYPWREYARELIHAGTFPAWNPHILSGVPFFSNPQVGLFSLFSLPIWVLPLDYGLGVSAALKLWAAAFGTYLLVRELRLGFLPGLLAGVSFGFCSLLVVWLTMEALPNTAAILPWTLWLAERTMRRGSLGSALALSVAVAVALGGGHPGTQVHVLFITALYAALRVALPAGEGAAAPLRDRLRSLTLAGGGIALGTMLMAAMLLPEFLSSRDTVGAGARAGGEGTLPGLREMPFDMIRTVLLPDWWGRPSAFETADSPTRTMFLNYLERTFYAGVVALLLGCIALGWRAAWRRMAPFAILAVLGLATALHAPGLWWLMTHLPVLELVQNQRLHVVFELGVAVLAAFGLQAVMERPAGQRWRLAVPLAALAAGLGVLTASEVSGADIGRVAEHFVTGADFEAAGVVQLTSVAWLALFALGVAAALAAAQRWPRRAAAIAAALVTLAAADMLHFAAGFNPSAPAEKAIPPTTPALEFLQARADEGRIAGLGLALPPDWSMRYGLRDVRGYDPPYPTRRYFDLWRTAIPGQDEWRPTTFDAINAETMHVMSVLGVRWLLTDPGTVLPDADGEPSLRALREVYDGPDARIFENARAAPRAMVAGAVRTVADEAQARALLVGEGVDVRQVAVVEDGPLTGAPTTGSAGAASVVQEDNARVVVRAQLERPGIVVLSDAFTSGWTAEVDGEPARVLHVNQAMRGAAVPAGAHEVVWRYAVPGLAAGVAVTLAAWVLLFAGAVVVWHRRSPSLPLLTTRSKREPIGPR